MSGNARKTNKRQRKRKDPARRRRIITASIAVIMVLAMVIAIFEALFFNSGISTPTPAVTIESNN